MSDPLTLELSINGTKQSVSVADSNEPLLYVLRNQLGQHGPKFGCGVQQCGACTVLVNGEVIRSCVKKIDDLSSGAAVTTLDGLGTPENPHPLQRAFVDQQAAQCGYCINGIMLGALAWLRSRFKAGNRAVPTDNEIKQFLSKDKVYLCRCGAHLRIIRAIQQAAKEMA